MGGITTEHLLQFPTLMPGIEIIFIAFTPLRLFDIGPVEHVHILSVTTNEEHRQGCGIVLLNDAVDDSHHGVLFVCGRRLALILTANHNGQHSNGK